MKTLLKGIVTSAAMPKTVVVKVERTVKHPLYNKVIRRTTKYHVHDEEQTLKLGDVITFRGCRPRSKTKRWELVDVIEKSN